MRKKKLILAHSARAARKAAEEQGLTSGDYLYIDRPEQLRGAMPQTHELIILPSFTRHRLADEIYDMAVQRRLIKT